jgi:hypothetical protein
MPKLILREQPNLIQIERERKKRFLELSGEDRIKETLALIAFSQSMSPNCPNKLPQGKGLLITKQKA